MKKLSVWNIKFIVRMDIKNKMGHLDASEKRK